MKSLLVVCLLLAAPAWAGENSETKTKAKSFWGKVKTGSKKAAKTVKQVGKDIGRGTQEIFDPNDEDLRKK